jgi:hypothetical protein
MNNLRGGGGNMVAPFDVTINATATLIVAFDPTRQSVTIFHESGTSPVYIGKSGVTTSTGKALASGDEVVMSGFTNALYGIVGSGSAVVSVSVVNAIGELP